MGVDESDFRIDGNGTLYATRTFRVDSKKGQSFALWARDSERKQEWHTHVNLTSQV